MSNQINIKNFLTTYGNHTIKMKCSATGYDDSDIVEKTIDYQPYISVDFDNNSIIFSHVIPSVIEYKLYGDNTLLQTYTTSQNSTNDITIDLTQEGIDIGDYQKYYLTTTISGMTYTSNEVSSLLPIGVSGFENSTTALTRTGFAENSTYTKTEITNGYKITSDLDNFFPFNSITEVTVGNDVMIQIPKIYWKIEVDDNNYLRSISCAQGQVDSSWFSTPATQIGKYLASLDNNEIFSKSGVSPTSGRYINQYGFNKGNNFFPFTIYHFDIMKALFWIYFAERNDDLVFKQTSSISNGKTGDTDSCQFMNCIYNGRFKFLGIEDFNGYLFQDIWGVYNGYVFDFNTMQSQVTNYNDASTDGKTAFSWNHARWSSGQMTSNTNYKAMYIEPNLKFIWFPADKSDIDTSNSYYAAQCKQNGFFSQYDIPNYGSQYNYYNYTAAHGFTWYDTTSRTSSSWGGRLVRFLS